MPANVTRPEPRILLVEDNPIDVIMMKHALKHGGFANSPIVVDDGEPAIAFLRRQGRFAGECLPELVILDLNLRKIDGPEVLSLIRQTPDLEHLTVIVVSSTPEDMMRSSAPDADCYLEKAADVSSLQSLGEKIRRLYPGGRAAPASS